MPKRSGSAIAFVLLVAGLGCRAQQAEIDAASELPSAEPPRPTNRTGVVIYPAAPGSFVELTAEAAPALVSIRSTRKVVRGPGQLLPSGGDEHALGSGFLIDGHGHILTNDHVLADASELRVVTADGVEHLARVVGRDPKLDVALLAIDGAARMTALPLGDSDRAQVGEWVAALGDPFGHGATVSAGVLSGLQQLDAQSLIEPDEHRYRGYLQTDASIHAGNSGGPLLNMAGEVIGINTAVAPTAGRASPIGYAVPINRAKAILPQLKEAGHVTRAWLGIYVRPVTPELAQKLGLDAPRGAYVTGVYEGSPAARGGIERGDVVLQLNGTDVDHRNLPWLAATTPVGSRMELSLWRGKGPLHLQITAEKMPE